MPNGILKVTLGVELGIIEPRISDSNTVLRKPDNYSEIYTLAIRYGARTAALGEDRNWPAYREGGGRVGGRRRETGRGLIRRT
jgi:hypothetical protein